MSDQDTQPQSERTPEERSPATEQHAMLGDDALQHLHQQLAREKEEPTEGFSPVPIFLLFLFGALVFWGGIYIANHSAEFRSDVFNPNYEPGAGDDVAMGPPTLEEIIKSGDKLYSNNCAACHQPTGAGIPGAFPPLEGSPWVVGSDERLVKILLRGLAGPIDVKGSTYNGSMPSYGENGLDWSDRKIQAITTYVRQAWGNDAPEVSEETVAAVREAVAGKSGTWTGEELLSAHPME